MPKVEDILLKLNGATYFTTLDLTAGYHHIPLDKTSILKTAYNSPFGKYEYVKVPFGLAQAPAYFQELMTGILKDFNFCDSLLRQHHNIQQESAKTSFTHQEGIQETMVSQTLHENEQMQLLFQGNPVFRAHSKHHRDSITTIKTHAIQHMQPPTTPKQVQVFLGLVGYYRKFINGFCQNSKTINIAYTPTGKV